MENVPNIPPADELHAVRERIKRDREREGELRSLMLSDPAARTGNDYIATIKVINIKRTDLVELRKCHPAVVAEFTFPFSETRVELHGIDDETGEIFSLRRKQGQQ